MVNKKDEGKRCRLVRDGDWGESNLRIHGKEGLSRIFHITEVYESRYGLFAQLEQTSPKIYPNTLTCFVERAELIDNDELDILT